MKSLKKNAFYSVLKAFLTLVFPIITFPYASRILGPEGIGKVNFANSVVSYFVMISALGIGGYACRELSKIKEDEYKSAKFVKEIYSINAVSTIVSYILFFCAYFFIPKLSEYRQLLLLCSIKILFSAFSVDWIYNAFEEFRYKTVRSFVFQLIGLVFLFLFVHSEQNIIAYAIFGLISNVGSNVFNLVHSRKLINYRIKAPLKPNLHLKAVFVFWGMSLVSSIYTTLDTTMLGFLSDDSAVGFYSAATKISHMILTMLTAITTVLMPRLSKYIGEGKQESFNELTRKSFNLMLILSVPMAVGLCILSKPITLILSGESYLPAVIPMMVITPIIVFIPCGSLLGGQVLPAIKKEKITFWAIVGGAVTNMTLNFIFIPRYGALGAGIGTICAEFIVVSIEFLYLKSFLIDKKSIINVIQVLFSCLLMAFSVLGFCYFVSNSILQIILGTIIGATVYAIMLFIIRNSYFLEYSKKLFQKIAPNG